MSALMDGVKSCCIIVAHPDDETLWCGGLILLNCHVDWTIITLCRKSDPDRSQKFFKVMKEYKAKGIMGDVDDRPEQKHLDIEQLKNTILNMMPTCVFDLIITHGSNGEYTRHRRHEQTSEAVLRLWRSKKILSKLLWQFAYEDGGGKYLPKPMDNADICVKLPEKIWKKKYKIITNIYGFSPDSFEAGSATKKEAFLQVIEV